MPRSRGGSGGRPSRSAPAPAPKRPTVVAPQQPSRGQPASTAAHPPATAQQAGPPAQQGRSPGLFGQMASTAAYVSPQLSCYPSIPPIILFTPAHPVPNRILTPHQWRSSRLLNRPCHRRHVRRLLKPTSRATARRQRPSQPIQQRWLPEQFLGSTKLRE